MMKGAQDAADLEAELDEWSRCRIVYKEGGYNDDEEDVEQGIDACAKKGSRMWQLFTEKGNEVREGMFKKKRFMS